MPKYTFTIDIPARLDRILVAVVLIARKLRYGYPFRRIKLTQGKYAIIDPEDYDKINQYKWHCINFSYAKRVVYKGRQRTDLYMHRFICPAPDDMVVDHINRNSLDNRKANLRPATQKQNVWNRERKNNLGNSPFYGVRWRKDLRKWQVRMYINGKRRLIGNFKDEIEAAKAYDNAAGKHRKEFAILNFPKDK